MAHAGYSRSSPARDRAGGLPCHRTRGSAGRRRRG